MADFSKEIKLSEKASEKSGVDSPAINPSENVNESTIDSTETMDPPEVILLSAEHTRRLPSAKREEDMTVEELAKEERRRGRAENIARTAGKQVLKDKRFNDGEDYLDENAERLGGHDIRKRKPDIDLRHIAIQGMSFNFLLIFPYSKDLNRLQKSEKSN